MLLQNLCGLATAPSVDPPWVNIYSIKIDLYKYYSFRQLKHRHSWHTKSRFILTGRCSRGTLGWVWCWRGVGRCLPPRSRRSTTWSGQTSTRCPPSPGRSITCTRPVRPPKKPDVRFAKVWKNSYGKVFWSYQSNNENFILFTNIGWIKKIPGFYFGNFWRNSDKSHALKNQCKTAVFSIRLHQQLRLWAKNRELRWKHTFYSTFSLKASKRWLRMQNVYVNSYHCCNVQILLHKVVTK